jgi:hypothetical protein
MKKAVALFLLAFVPLSALAQAKKTAPKESMWAKVTLHINWNKRNENSGEVRTGVWNVSMNGRLKLNHDFSGKSGRGRFSPLLGYTLENPTFNYNYREDWSIERQDNPPDCPNPQRTMYKTGSAAGDQGDMPANLIVHYNAALFDAASSLPVQLPPEAQDAIIDYYEFVVLTPAQKAEGKLKVMDSKTKQCKEIDQTDPILDGEIDIAWMIGTDGRLAGSKSWSSEAQSNTCMVKVANLQPSFKKKEAEPKPGGKNDVHYSLTWDFDAAPEAQVEREIDGRWFDVTGVDQTVQAYDVIKLRGLVAPRSMDKATGRWNISNETTVFPMKGDLDAVGRNIPGAQPVTNLTPGDLAKKELVFWFADPGESEVTYTTHAGGQEVTATVKFTIKRRVSQ